MRTAEICSDCATYINASCILYNGEYLSTLNIEPLDSVETALAKIDAYLAQFTTTTTTTSSSTSTTSTTTTLL